MWIRVESPWHLAAFNHEPQIIFKWIFSNHTSMIWRLPSYGQSSHCQYQTVSLEVDETIHVTLCKMEDRYKSAHPWIAAWFYEALLSTLGLIPVQLINALALNTCCGIFACAAMIVKTVKQILQLDDAVAHLQSHNSFELYIRRRSISLELNCCSEVLMYLCRRIRLSRLQFNFESWV